MIYDEFTSTTLTTLSIVLGISNVQIIILINKNVQNFGKIIVVIRYEMIVSEM